MGIKYEGVRELAQAFGRVPITLRRELRPELRKAGQTLLDDMHARASYSSRIPGATRMTVRFTAKGGGIFFRVNAAKAPHARPLERGNRGRGGASFRHPVFGDRDDWVNQPTRPFFFPAVQEGAAEVRDGIADAVRKSLREVKR